jgi:hypothetical protein
VRWRTGSASAAEIHALRNCFTAFRDVSFRELLATVGKQPAVPIGTFNRSYAEELRREGTDHGLLVEMTPVDPEPSE